MFAAELIRARSETSPKTQDMNNPVSMILNFMTFDPMRSPIADASREGMVPTRSVDLNLARPLKAG